MEDATQVIGWSTAIVAVIGALVAAFIKLRKSKLEVTIEEQKLAHSEAREAYHEAKSALLLLVEEVRARVEAMALAQERDSKRLQEASDKHHQCELEMMELKGDMKVMRKDLEALQRHEVANKQNNEKLKQLVETDLEEIAKKLEQKQ